MIDSGFRCHLTSFNRATASAPSVFVQKLRKCLKTRRVTGVKQVGTDRILEISFSEGLYRLYLEFYAAGNVVLTDGEGVVLSPLRTVNEENEVVRTGVKYDLSMRQNIEGVPELTKERIKEGLQKAVERQQAADDVEEVVGAKKKRKKSAKDALRRSLAVCINEYPPILVDHAMKVQQFDSTVKPEEVLSSEDMLDKLLAVLQEAKSVVSEITASAVVKGYIMAKENDKRPQATADGDGDTPSNLLYEDFHPFKPAQFENEPQTTFLEFEGFNKTVDEFFSSIEGQKLESRLHEREAAAQKKLQQARTDHERRIGGLQQQQELNIQKAEAILANVERVQEAQAAVNGLIGQGMDWVDIARLIEGEQARGNPVASYIKLPLKLYENTITLLLGQAEELQEHDDSGYIGSDTESEASDSDDEAAPSETPRTRAEDQRLTIDIDLALTPWANASQYYDQKKSAAVKETKTVQASTQALKSAERKIAADLKKGLDQEKEILRPVRKQFWFEKFYYFISSDGYLVLGGKDAQQNEILYRRYLRKGDVYVHADLNGAASVIIKNNPTTPDAPIPPSTLSQAGTFSVATSSAWDNKAVMSAYWVNADQVSKTAPTGEYLTTGGFMVRGKKNYLPPAQLLLGFAAVWQISEESKANHRKHRVDEPPMSDLGESVASLNVDEDEKNDEKQIEGEENDDDDDDDEDFPDATIETKHADSDDEDFPDAKLDRKDESDSDSDDEQGNIAHKANPLQPSSAPPREEADEEDELTADEADGRADTEPAQAVRPPQRHLTAQERQQLRSGKIPDSTDHSGTSTPKSSTNTNAAKSKNQPAPRGKRGKQKKAAAKYADQDPEDRELAMRLLGSKTGQDAAVEAAEARKAKLDEEERQKQRRREQHARTQEEGKAAEARRLAQLEGDGGGEEGEEDEAEVTLQEMGLDSFTGRPLPGDELMAAIPICAPWNALASYKYKVKLQPGTVKKGKAVGQILDGWAKEGKDSKKVDRAGEDSEKMWPREVELLRGWKKEEVVGVLPVKGCRVMMAGGGDGKGGKGGGGGGGKKAGGKGGAKGGKGKKK